MGACATKTQKKKPLEPESTDPQQQQEPPQPPDAVIPSNEVQIQIEPSPPPSSNKKISPESDKPSDHLLEKNQSIGVHLPSSTNEEALVDLLPIQLNEENNNLAPLDQAIVDAFVIPEPEQSQIVADPIQSAELGIKADEVKLISSSKISIQQDGENKQQNCIDKIESSVQNENGAAIVASSTAIAGDEQNLKQRSSGQDLEQENEEEEDEGKKAIITKMKPTLVSFDQQSMTQFTGLMNDYISKKDDNQTSETATATNMQITRGKKSAVISTHESGIVLKVLSPTQESFQEVLEEDGIREIPDAAEEEEDEFNNEENLTEENTESINQKNYHLQQIGEGIMTNMILNLEKRNPMDQTSQIIAVGY